MLRTCEFETAGACPDSACRVIEFGARKAVGTAVESSGNEHLAVRQQRRRVPLTTYSEIVGGAPGIRGRVIQLRDARSDAIAQAARDQEFVGKFNKLITKLIDFAESYRNKQAIDVKKARDIRKAWLELEKAEALFRDDSKK